MLLAACGAVYWSVVAYRVVSAVRALPSAAQALKWPSARTNHTPSVCVVVPAHNEVRALPNLIRSLKAQDWPAMRVVIALDRCTDGTNAAARSIIGADGRFEIVEIDECPDGWAGKVHAIHAGVHRSEGARDAELLIFTDADCRFEIGAIRAAVALRQRRGLDMLSLLSRLAVESMFERVIQPVASFELLRQYPLERVNRSPEDTVRRQRPFANGQFILFRREAYERLGGHEAVRDELLEDIAFAKLAHAARMKAGCLLAGSLVRCRMYDSWKRFEAGWKRIYIEAANCRSGRLRQNALRLAFTGALLPVCSVAALFLGGAAVVAGAAGTGAWLAAVSLIARSAGAGPVAVLAWPIGCLAVTGLLMGAAGDLSAGRPVKWGGREYVRPDRSKTEPRKGEPAAVSV